MIGMIIFAILYVIYLFVKYRKSNKNNEDATTFLAEIIFGGFIYLLAFIIFLGI